MTLQVTQGDSDGWTACGASEKYSVFGATPAVQASAIPAVTGTVSLTTTINAILTVIRNFGNIAAS